MHGPATRLTGVSFSYRRRPVLDRFDWEVPGTRTILLGPNGAGKSTVLQLLAGMLAPRRGTIEGPHGARAGYMPQTVRAVPGLTVLEQVAYCAWLKGLARPRARDEARAALDTVRLGPRHADRVTRLSGGQLRRVGLAQALVGRSELLLLDEPTAGLDPAQRDNFADILAGVTVPVVVATHQIEDIGRTYRDVVVLGTGTIRFQGTVEQFLERDATGAGDPRGAYRSVLGEDGEDA